MAEYNVGFSTKLIDAARFVRDQGIDSEDAIRTVLYLSKLACEITIKALLEKAGKPVDQIKTHGHDLRKLLLNVGQCKVYREVTKGALRPVPAKCLNSETVDDQYGNATVGNILRAEELGASKYPNEIRYGNNLRDYPPELWLKTATVIRDWAQDHWDDIHI